MTKRHLLKLETKKQPLLSPGAFGQRVAKSFALASALILLSLLAGMIGYHYLEQLSWMDAYVNAAMILSGMGPLDAPKSGAGKLFAGTYALYSGLAVLIAAAVLLTPVFHRILHEFHLEDDEEK